MKKHVTAKELCDCGNVMSPERGDRAQILGASPMKNGTTEDFLPPANARLRIELKTVQKCIRFF